MQVKQSALLLSIVFMLCIVGAYLLGRNSSQFPVGDRVSRPTLPPVAGSPDGRQVPVSGDVAGTTWSWKETLAPNGTVLTPRRPELFTLTFEADGVVNGTTDCNSFSGEYNVGVSGKLAISNIMMSTMSCEDSQESEYLAGVRAVNGYEVKDDGQLHVTLGDAGGTMIFLPDGN